MSTASYTYDPRRRALVLPDARLTKLMQREPETCASLDEYAQRTGIPTEQILTLLAPAIDDGVLGLDVCGDGIFLNTAPQGRPGPTHLPEVAPNLWERLRGHGDAPAAYMLWRLVRSMELAGWRVEANPHRIRFGLGPLPFTPALGVQIAQTMIPLVLHPECEVLAHANGPLSVYDLAGAPTVGVVCDSGALDSVATAARRWGLGRRGKTSMGVVVLEAPRYAPTLLTPSDASVRPRSVSQSMLDNDRNPLP
jgi:hypothetical protein